MLKETERKAAAWVLPPPQVAAMVHFQPDTGVCGWRRGGQSGATGRSALANAFQVGYDEVDKMSCWFDCKIFNIQNPLPVSMMFFLLFRPPGTV